MKPFIGLSMDLSQDDKNDEFVCLKKKVLGAVREAGGNPLPLPPTADLEDVRSYLSLVSGVVITGGDFDIPPHYYGETDQGKVRRTLAERSAFEKLLLEEAWQRGFPILGICGGAQLLNVFRGGTLIQHVENHEGGIVHDVEIQPETLLRRLLSSSHISIRSTHHQSIGRVGKGLQVSAKAKDQVVEAIEVLPESYDNFCLGVQWHPEAQAVEQGEQRKIFQGFVQAARLFSPLTGSGS